MRHRHLALVREPAGTLGLVHLHLTGNGHQRKLTIVIDPRARLMRLFKTINLVSRIGILPAIPHLVGAGCPEVHAPRHRNGRISVAGRKLKAGLRTHQRIHVLCVILLCFCTQDTAYNRYD